ncbi:MAG: cell division protein ZapA [Deltaproteobacteria bacterium]|nr:cell division protein ZapA [Deltaproteobacteria bacterium]
MKKRYHIKILGQELSVLSEAGDEHVARVVEYVNNKVKELGDKPGSINTVNVAILVALNIADEYLSAKGVSEEIYDQLGSRSEKLIHLIDEIK